MIHTISTFFTRHKKAFFLVGFAIILLCQFELSFAAEADSVQTSFIDVIQGGLKIIASLLGVLTTLVALFLNPEWTSGTAFGLQEHLKEIWILVSNVVYFVFAMILIVIAFMNIIGKGDKWELKSALPRFIVGVLIVPFSWFFVQFVVSISAILTIGVLTLPYDTFKDKDFFTNINSKFEICTHPIIDLGSIDTNKGGSENLKQSYSCAEGAKKTIDQILNSEEGGLKNGVFGIISIYTYGILGGDAMDHITKGQLVSLKSVVDLGVKGIFDLIFIIVYCLLMFALFLALFVRGVWLWMYMMLSPAFGLLYFFEKGDEGVADGKFSIKEFISLALVPVYVCAALSFGLVFLFVASDGIGQSLKKGDAGTETLSLAGLNLTIKGFQGNSEEGVLNTAQGALSTLIIEMFGIVILWIAVMAALKSSSTTGAIIEPIDAFGKQVGSLVAKAPTYAPIIPTPGGGMQSAASLNAFGQSVSQSFESQLTQRGRDFADKTVGKTPITAINGKLAGIGNNINGKVSDSLMNQIGSAIREANGNADDLFRSDLKDYMKQIGEKAPPGSELLKLKDISTKDDFARGLDILQKQNPNQIIIPGEVGKLDIRGFTDLERLMKKPDEASISETPLTSSTATVTNNVSLNISDADYNTFLEPKGHVSDTILKSIATKISKSQTLDTREEAIREGKNSEIEELLKALKDSN